MSVWQVILLVVATYWGPERCFSGAKVRRRQHDRPGLHGEGWMGACCLG